MLKILLATFVIISHFAIAEEKTDKIEKQPTQCHDLHKVTDIDDLLLQMYNNLDSHCLFEMPKEELGEVWGIPVFDALVFVNGVTTSSNDDEYAYDKNGKGLYISRSVQKKDICMSRIIINKTKYYEKKHQGWGGSFQKGTFPKLLPSPVIRQSSVMNQFFCKPKRITDYDCYKKYIWDKQNTKNLPSITIGTHGNAEPRGIRTYYCNFNFRHSRGWYSD